MLPQARGPALRARAPRTSWSSRRCTAPAATACWSGPASTRREIEEFRARIMAQPGALHRAADAGAVDLPDLRRARASRRATSTCGRSCCRASEVHDGAGRPHARRAARRLAGGQLVAGRRHEGHLGAGGTDACCSRTADHLYWMSRYIERAENMARMLDAQHRLSLLPRPPEAVLQGWQATLVSLGIERSVPRAARARSRRARPSTSWRSTRAPGQHRVVPARGARERARRARHDHLRSVGDAELDVARVALVQRDDARVGARRVLRVGEVPRAPDARRHCPARCCGTRRSTSCASAPSSSAPTTRRGCSKRAGAIRAAAASGCWPRPRSGRCCCGRCRRSRSIRRLYRDSVTPKRVTEMLLMRDDLPQSVHRCLDELQSNLAAVANSQSTETLRRVGELHAQFHFGRFEELCAERHCRLSRSVPGEAARSGRAHRGRLPRAHAARTRDRHATAHPSSNRLPLRGAGEVQRRRRCASRRGATASNACSPGRIQAPGRRTEQVDAHGNITHLLTLEEPHREIAIVVTRRRWRLRGSEERLRARGHAVAAGVPRAALR